MTIDGHNWDEQTIAAKWQIDRSDFGNSTCRHSLNGGVMPEKRAMNSTMPYDQDSDRMQTTGNVVFFLAVSSLLAVILCTFAFFAVLSSDNGFAGQIAHVGRVLGSYLGLVALAAFSIELLTIGLLAISAARWHFSILRDRRWIASVACAMLAFLITIALMFLYVIVATSHA